jgi:hypothetical protein
MAFLASRRSIRGQLVLGRGIEVKELASLDGALCFSANIARIGQPRYLGNRAARRGREPFAAEDLDL